MTGAIECNSPLIARAHTNAAGGHDHAKRRELRVNLGWVEPIGIGGLLGHPQPFEVGDSSRALIAGG